ncbi:branched-chain amino acid transporter AzlD [Sporanaerobium hydrogeniformans]|uniref:Branched-chain amino acid transporter AzlD n=1 Tax=Sporanaerobium hydrogeniformans TaxID=3072179 RepID=A0AC61DBF9_9FIRM|nr:AzlD domain-containing protein [Sporanaerobium hydrogeniformans]PHV70090.1 branched-chain amino acid transporter AzlD [Sporanaerobium hydrogeniformans]
MLLNSTQTLIMIGAVALGMIINRFLPFLLFPENKKVPNYVSYLGKVLPYAVMGLLVVFCLKSISFIKAPFGVPEFLCVAFTAFLHYWKGNTLLSISTGTVLYMILIQFIFV